MPLVQRQADSGKITVSASEPATPLKGDLWYDTDDNKLLSYNGSAFVGIGLSLSEAHTWSGAQTFESIAAGVGFGKLELLDAKIMGSDAISYTFTPSADIDFADYSKVIMIIQGAKAEAGATTGEFILNGYTANYHYEKLSVNAGSGTFSGATAQNNLPVSSSIQASAAFNATITVILNDLDEGAPQIDTTYSNHTSQNDQFHWGHNTGVSAIDIDTMKFQLGAGTLLAGTRLYTYGLRR